MHKGPEGVKLTIHLSKIQGFSEFIAALVKYVQGVHRGCDLAPLSTPHMAQEHKFLSKQRP